MSEEKALAVDVVPSFAIRLDEAARRLAQFREFIQSQMVEGEDYGLIPGTDKPTLLKPGAEKLCNIFGFAAEFEEVRCVEDWEKGFFYYVYRCTIVNKRTGQIEAQCIASCNSKEDKYRWRYQERICPQCGKAAIIKGREEYGGGWVCFQKKGGCGAKFPTGDPAIEDQPAGRVENPDPYTLVNTIQKMAQKRALIGAILIATRASGFFTQDLEDISEEIETGKPQTGSISRGKPQPSRTKSNGRGGDFWTFVYGQYARELSLETAEAKKRGEAALAEANGDVQKAMMILKFNAFLQKYALTQREALAALGTTSISVWLETNPGKTLDDAFQEILAICGRG